MSLEINFNVQTSEITAKEIDLLTNFLQSLKQEEEKPGKPVTKKPRKLKAEEPKVEEPKAEEPKVEEPKAEEPKVEEFKPEEPKVEEFKPEEPKVEEFKPEEPKVPGDGEVSPEMLNDLRKHAVQLISNGKDSHLKGVLAKYGVSAISKLPKAGAEELLAVSAE